MSKACDGKSQQVAEIKSPCVELPVQARIGESRCGVRGFDNDTKLATAGVGGRSFMVQFTGTVMNIPVVRERERMQMFWKP